MHPLRGPDALVGGFYDLPVWWSQPGVPKGKGPLWFAFVPLDADVLLLDASLLLLSPSVL